MRYKRREICRGLPHVGTNPEKCGRTRRKARVDLVMSQNSAYFNGLVNCAQVWACPVCAYRIANVRGKELTELIENHRKTGGGVYLVTVTLPHNAGDRLKKLRSSVTRAWSAIFSGKPWLTMKYNLRFIGYVRALEVTLGPNGWHPHLHSLFFTETHLSAAEVVRLRIFIFNRWSGQVQKFGYRPPDERYGVMISEGEEAGFYVSKMVKQGLAEEVSAGVKKRGKQKSFTVLDLLDRYAEDKSGSERVLLGEWISAMYGARQLTWSKGLKRKLGYKELSDKAVVEAEENPAPADRVVLSIEAKLWDRFFVLGSTARWNLIALAELKNFTDLKIYVQSTLGPTNFAEFLNYQRRIAPVTGSLFMQIN